MTGWCAISSHDTTGPCLFENVEACTVTADAEWSKIMPENFLQNELCPCQLDLLCFQWDEVTVQTTQISMQVLGAVFPGRLISRIRRHHLANPNI